MLFSQIQSIFVFKMTCFVPFISHDFLHLYIRWGGLYPPHKRASEIIFAVKANANREQNLPSLLEQLCRDAALLMQRRKDLPPLRPFHAGLLRASGVVSTSVWSCQHTGRCFLKKCRYKDTDAREIGAEWVCLRAIRELEIDKFLKVEGWSEIQINTMLAHLIIRTVYSPSELESMRIMEENGDYYLEINSPAKQLRETSKNRQFKERSEELQKTKDSLTKKD